MSREIKFRVWDKLEQSMKPSPTIMFQDGLFVWKYVSAMPWQIPAECNLMQYTGLKDKNGVEIYEGDIVSNNVYTEEVEWSDSLTGFKPFMEYDSDCGIYYTIENCEVIGNIYETPGLLE